MFSKNKRCDQNCENKSLENNWNSREKNHITSCSLFISNISAKCGVLCIAVNVQSWRLLWSSRASVIKWSLFHRKIARASTNSAALRMPDIHCTKSLEKDNKECYIATSLESFAYKWINLCRSPCSITIWDQSGLSELDIFQFYVKITKFLIRVMSEQI